MFEKIADVHTTDLRDYTRTLELSKLARQASSHAKHLASGAPAYDVSDPDVQAFKKSTVAASSTGGSPALVPQTIGEAPITLFGGNTCLPPGTKVRCDAKQLILSNPFCEISLFLESASGVMSGLPAERDSGSMEQLPSGGPRWE